MQKNVLYNRKKKDPMEFSTPKNVLYQEPFKIKESLGLTEEATPTATSTQPASIPETPPNNLLSLPKDSFSQYWKQPVGKTQVPLDQFVRLAGMAAHALDPEGFGGRLGKDLSTMGAEAYGERAKREYESPNQLLRQQLLTAQIEKIKAEQPGKWEAWNRSPEAQALDPLERVRKFTEATTTAKDPTLSAYKTFYSSQKAAGKSDAEIDTEWTKRQKDLAKERKTEVSTEQERLYSSYKKQFKTAKGEGVVKSPTGKMMTPWEFKKHMEPFGKMYMTDKGPVFATKAGGLMDAQGNIVPTDIASTITGIPKPKTSMEKRLEKILAEKEAKKKSGGVIGAISKLWSQPKTELEAPELSTEGLEQPQLVPPEGFVDSGKTSGGKKVYLNADGSKAWIQQ